MRINTNISAMNAHRQLGINTANGAKSMERLSSGLRINRSADDAAGLAISEKMRGQIRGLNQASRNAQDGISLIQTAEGSLTETHSILQRMRELAAQAATDTNVGVDRNEIQKELNALTSEINRIGNTTEFNSQKLLNGSTVGAVGDITNVVGVTGGTAGSTTFSINTALAAGESFDVAGQTITAYADAAARTAAGDTAYGILATDTAEVQAAAVRAMTFAGTTVTGAVAKVIITQTVAGTGDVTGPTIVRSPGYNADLQIGANYAQSFRINIADMRSTALDISGNAAGGTVTAKDGAIASFVFGTANVSEGTSNDNTEFALDVSSHAKATAAISVISDSIETVSAERSKLGAMQNRLEHTIANLGTSSENLQAAESRIRDVDMAAEMMEFTKSNILNQAATAMLAQANMAPQSVLQLLG